MEDFENDDDEGYVHKYKGLPEDIDNYKPDPLYKYKWRRI